MTERTARALWVAVAPCAAALAWVARGLDRGLETTDESYYLLSAMHADGIGLFFTPFHWVTGPLWQLAGSLVVFRAIGLAACVGSALLLAWAVLRVASRANFAIEDTAAGRAALFATSASGALLYGSLLNFTPSYNLLATAACCTALALALLAVVAERRRAVLAAAGAGVALALGTAAKFSAGASTAGLVAVVWLALASRREAARLAWLALAAVLTFAVLVLANGTPQTALAQFRAGVDVIWVVQGDHTTAGRLARSAGDVLGMLGAALAAFWGPLALIAVATWLRVGWLAVVALAWLAAELVGGGHLGGGYSRFTQQAQPLVALLAAALLARSRDGCGGWRTFVLFAVLALLPLAIAIGTSNPLHVQLLGSLAPWGLLVGAAGFAAPWRWPAAIVSVLFGATVLAQVLGHAGEPYRMRPLAQQIERIELPALGSLRVDRETAAMARAVQEAAARCGIRAGTPFIDLYDLPVVALVLGARPVVSPWLLDAGYAARVLSRAEAAEVHGATLAIKLDAQDRRPPLPPQLAAFPHGWRACGRGIAPLDGRPFEIWAAAPPAR